MTSGECVGAMLVSREGCKYSGDQWRSMWLQCWTVLNCVDVVVTSREVWGCHVEMYRYSGEQWKSV